MNCQMTSIMSPGKIISKRGERTKEQNEERKKEQKVSVTFATSSVHLPVHGGFLHDNV